MKDFWIELWNNKWWIILFCLPFGTYFGYKASKEKITYDAALTYTLSDASGGGLGGILGSFGLGQAGKLNLDRIVELSKSRNIIQKVLFKKIELDTFKGKPDFIANHLISLEEFDKVWAKTKPKYEKFRFSSADISTFSQDEMSVLKMLYQEVVGNRSIDNPIFTNGFNEGTGILTMHAKTVDEQLSIGISNCVFDEVKRYYISIKTASPDKNVKFVAEKTDSIANLLKSKQYQLARFNDTHRNLVDPDILVQKKMIETDIQKLTIMYGEATKNYEIADFSLLASSPEINLIDEPLPPLDPDEVSLIISIIKGLLIGGLLATVFFIGRKIFRDAMNA